MFEKIKKENFGIIRSVKLNYEMLIKKPILVIPMILLLVLNYFYSFKHIVALNISIYAFVVFYFEYLISGRKKYELKRVLLFILILYALYYVPFQHIFLVFPIMLLTRKLSVSQTLLLSLNVLSKNMVKFFLIVVINIIIISIITVLVIYGLSYAGYQESFSDILKVRELLLTQSYFNIFINYIFAMQFYLVYKMIEYGQIIRGEN